MTHTIELPDEKANQLLNLLDRNARADSIETSFYWQDDDIGLVEELHEDIAEQIEVPQ